MPRIPDANLESVVYLYPNKADALAARQAGGTGFLVAVCLTEPRWQVYVVTCEHVAKDNIGVRINTKDGKADVLEIPRWVAHPGGDDLAVAPLDLGGEHRWHCVMESEFISRQDIQKYGIGPGDDTYMVGRFINHEGQLSNTPAARFGNLAMLPYKIQQPDRNFDQESFLVESRSLSGFSGSPVFLQIFRALPRPHGPTDLSRREERTDAKSGISILSVSSNEIWTGLLGVDWGHLQGKEEALGQGGFYFYAPNSGMSGVVPAWKLRELLDVPELMAQRAEEARRRG